MLGAATSRIGMICTVLMLSSSFGASQERSAKAIEEASARYEAAHPGVLKIGGEVKPPKLVDQVHPDWQRIPAQKRKYRWPIILEAVITQKGEVLAPTILSGAQPVLDTVVLQAVRQWRYEPAARADKAVAVFLTVTVTF
ncbi:MAG TPA: energy transducer TonB [Thermoanaerobaculia bacterium]|jgi:TonB family protein